MQMDFEKAETIQATILLKFSFHWTTFIFQLGRDIDKSNYFMDFKRRKKGDNRLRVARPLTLCIRGTLIKSDDPDFISVYTVCLCKKIFRQKIHFKNIT